MRLYHVSVRSLIIRFHLITAIIVISGFGALFIHPAFWFLSALAFPVFLSCLLGIDFEDSRFLHKLEFWHRHHRATDKEHRLAH